MAFASVLALLSAFVSDATAFAMSTDRAILPMGWMSTYRCGISENLIRNATLAMVENGWLDAGYDTIHVDNCWADKNRDSSGRLVADSFRFPNGIKALTDWVHSQGMKLGIYSAAAPQTCAKYQPGSEGSEAIDAQTFIDWGVDYLKFDGCQNNMTRMQASYKAMGNALRGSNVQYACSLGAHGGSPTEMIEDGCDLWRMSHDIQPKKGYSDLIRISTHWAENVNTWRQFSGPSSHGQGWFDPDQLLTGDGRFNEVEWEAQFGLWAMLSAPLILGNHVTSLVNPEIKYVYQNPEIIAIARDPLAEMGGRVGQLSDDHEVWARKLDGGALALLLWNKATPDACTWSITQYKDVHPADHDFACVEGARFDYTRLECCMNMECNEFAFTAPGGTPADVGNGCFFKGDAPNNIWQDSTETDVVKFTLTSRNIDAMLDSVRIDFKTLIDAGLWHSSQALVRNVLWRQDTGIVEDYLQLDLSSHEIVVYKLMPVGSLFV